MNRSQSPLTLKAMIDPEHLLLAIDNPLQHSDETTHGVTGICFENYTLTVRKLKGLCWYIECKFKSGKRQSPRSNSRDSRRLRCPKRLKRR
jgi:hypothetical protein